MENEAECGGEIPMVSSLKTDVARITALDYELWDVTRGMSIKLGSILRLPSSAYANWGIGITDENRAELERMSKGYFAKDFQEDMTRQQGPYKEDLIRTPQRIAAEKKMAVVIGDAVGEMISQLDDGKREFAIADVSARNPLVARQIVSALYQLAQQKMLSEDILQRITFDLAYPLGAKLSLAKAGVEHPNSGSIRNHAFMMDADEYLSMRGGRLDFIVSTAYFHRYSFPGYLEKVHDALVPGGVFLSGDFHGSPFHYPLQVYEMLARLNFDSRRLDRFREVVGVGLFNAVTNPMHEEEQNANEAHLRDINDAKALMRRTQSLGNQRLYVLNAYEPLTDRLNRMENAGLNTDISGAFPFAKEGRRRPNVLREIPARVQRSSDYAIVTGGMRAR
ncbi:MAG: class I SAM-dependent methyltransferase [Candidatus Micrarchaeota archaeon]